jgi:hypothetical protein
MSGPDMAYGRWMAAACTMTVMCRGLWKRGRRGWTHKSIKSVCMDSAVLLYHHSPSPGFLSLPDELNYLLSLLTLDDCSFPMARYHLYHWCHVPMSAISLVPLVWRSQEHALVCCQVPTIITFLSRLERSQCLVLYSIFVRVYPCA